MGVKTGNVTIPSEPSAGFDGTVATTWQPAAGEVWQITKMIIEVPEDQNTGFASSAVISMTNGSNDIYIYNLTLGSALPTGRNAIVFGSNVLQNSSLLRQGALGSQAAVLIKDDLYISNSYYLKIVMTNGFGSASTGTWWIQGTNVTDKIYMDVKTGNVTIPVEAGAGFDGTVATTWQPAAGEVWQITKMIIEVPEDQNTGFASSAVISMTNGSNDIYIYNLTLGSALPTGRNAIVFGSNVLQNSSLLRQGALGSQAAVLIKDDLYISNSYYLKIVMTNGFGSASTGTWWIQGTMKK